MKLWITFSLFAVALVSGFNLVATVRRVPPPARIPAAEPANVVLRQEQRFAAVPAALRAHGVRGTIGYFADLPPEQLRADAAGMEEYFLTQFALVPWVLDASSDHSAWAVTNLRRGTLPERGLVGYETVQELGAGVFLLKRRAP